MKAAPLLISWHNDHQPIYAAHFEPQGKGRLATAGGDNNVRVWRIESDGLERKAVYLSTLRKHTQSVNVVRFAPRGEVIATAGDDGNALLWIPSETGTNVGLGEDGLEDLESWRVRHMCRSLGTEIYDLAWSPDAVFFITGSMDNIARIYNAQTGQMVRQIAEHNHYVQGVAWDPLNEFVATQSSDRSVHVYNLKTKDGEPSLMPHNKVSRMDIPHRRISSPALPEGTFRPPALPDSATQHSISSPAPSPSMRAPSPSIPGTPTSLPFPMNPPRFTHSRRSSFAPGSPASRRSMSPAPNMPLPAVRPIENSPIPFGQGAGTRQSLYANEALNSFFRRLNFAPDGSLLFTPAGQLKLPQPGHSESEKGSDDVVNTVFIYTRAGLNKPPVAHLPGHKKPSIAVKCSPVFYNFRSAPASTTHLTIDTSSGDVESLSLPDSLLDQQHRPASSVRPTSSWREGSIPRTAPSPAADRSKLAQPESPSAGTPAPFPAFNLPYRIVYAVITQDSVLVYDTQQQTPICVVANLHFATFTDLTWSHDGQTLLMSSSDGFCSVMTFAPGELGQVYTPPLSTSTTFPSIPAPTRTVHSSLTPISVPASNRIPPSTLTGLGSPVAPSSYVPSPMKSRSNSASSTMTTMTQGSFAPSTFGHSHSTSTSFIPPIPGNSPAPIVSNMPGVTVSGSSAFSSIHTHTSSQGLPLQTPPMTPGPGGSMRRSSSASRPGKRPAPSQTPHESDSESKKRRIAPTPVVDVDSLPGPEPFKGPTKAADVVKEEKTTTTDKS